MPSTTLCCIYQILYIACDKVICRCAVISKTFFNQLVNCDFMFHILKRLAVYPFSFAGALSLIEKI
jgi:hypothetical protein